MEPPEDAPSPRRVAIGTGFDREGGGLYLVDADGTDPKEISRGLQQAHNPRWSPDGRWIVVNGSTDVDDPASGGIYRVAADGSGQRRLTSNGHSPDPSPDGSRITFVLFSSRQTDIAVMDADGKNVKNLTRSATSEGAPRWSPLGDHIAYVGGAGEMRVMRTDGTQSQRVSPLGHTAIGTPAWSPDGRSIAYVARAADLTEGYLYVSTLGGEVRRIRSALEVDEYPVSWSPDGRWLAFVDRATLLVSVVRPDGSGFRSITTRADVSFHISPSWDPTGGLVAHIRSEGDSRNVWTVTADGATERRIASTPQPASSLAWGP